jgi:ABC-2 type transport system ATP-binding protein
LIQVEAVSKRYGKTVAVDGLSFVAERGRVTGFLGPNGAGKTTTLRILLGLVRPQAGTATIDGRPYARLEEPSRTVGAVLETTSFHPGRTGRNHLRVLAAAAGLHGARIEEVLALVDLRDAASRRVGGYSLGMRQRLGLAAALLGEPRVLVLDEPANGLDPQGIRWLRTLLRAQADQGLTVLVSSHVLAELAQLADDAVIIHRGRFVAQGSVAELTARATAGTRARSPEAGRLADSLRAAGVEARADGDVVLASTEPSAVGEAAAAAGIILHELVGQAATLEEAFLELTREGGTT